MELTQEVLVSACPGPAPGSPWPCCTDVCELCGETGRASALLCWRGWRALHFGRLGDGDENRDSLSEGVEEGLLEEVAFGDGPRMRRVLFLLGAMSSPATPSPLHQTGAPLTAGAERAPCLPANSPGVLPLLYSLPPPKDPQPHGFPAVHFGPMTGPHLYNRDSKTLPPLVFLLISWGHAGP